MALQKKSGLRFTIKFTQVGVDIQSDACNQEYFTQHFLSAVGIDVKQALNSTAVVTIGKDMTMRDVRRAFLFNTPHCDVSPWTCA